MREIEFRAWDGTEYTFWNMHEDAKGWWEMAMFAGCPIEQYTGVKDKNGVKIFEGDIVVAKNCFASEYDAEPSTYSIGFEDGTFVFQNSLSPVRQWSDGCHDWYSIENVETFEIEVVGNIHTNKGEY